MLITKPFRIHGTHDGIKYTLEEKDPTDVLAKYGTPYSLYIWYELTKEYIFEQSVKDEEHAKQRMSELKNYGYLA